MHRLSILYGMQFHDTDFLCSSAPLTRLHPSGWLSFSINSSFFMVYLYIYIQGNSRVIDFFQFFHEYESTA